MRGEERKGQRAVNGHHEVSHCPPTPMLLDQDLAYVWLISLLLFLPTQDEIPAPPRALSRPIKDLPTSKPFPTSWLSTSRSADGTLRGAGLRTRSPQTHKSASHTVSLSIAGAFPESAPSTAGDDELSSSLRRSEPGPQEEPPSEATDDSLNGSPHPCAELSPWAGRARPPLGSTAWWSQGISTRGARHSQLFHTLFPS